MYISNVKLIFGINDNIDVNESNNPNNINNVNIEAIKNGDLH